MTCIQTGQFGDDFKNRDGVISDDQKSRFLSDCDGQEPDFQIKSSFIQKKNRRTVVIFKEKKKLTLTEERKVESHKLC